MKVVFHQGSILSRLLFIIVLEVLSCKFCSGVLWEDQYAFYLVTIADLLEECIRWALGMKRSHGKEGVEDKCRKDKINVMMCCTGLDLLQSSGEYPCTVCRTGVLLQWLETLGA